MNVLRVEVDSCLGISTTAADLKRCWKANASVKVNVAFTAAVKKCPTCSKIRSEFGNCMIAKDPASKHADCTIHNELVK